MKKTHAALFLLLTIFANCVKRDDSIHQQDNPFDSGGQNWTKNQPPIIINHSSSSPRWFDFYFPDSTGSIQLSFTASDPDGKAQLLSVSVYLSTDNSNFIQQALDTSLQSDSMVRIRGIVPNKNYLYKIIVRDSTLDPNKAKLIKSASDTAEGSFTSPAGLPPHPPQRIVVDNKPYVIILKWDSTYTDSLVIFRSRSSTGPYVPVDTIAAQSFPDVQMVTGLYYYRAGAQNKHGMAWYKDTLTGLIYNSTLTTSPALAWDTIQYDDSIGLTWTKPFISNYTVDGFSLYRAKHPAGPYSKIADTNALQYTYRYVDRNIRKTDDLYYRLTYTTKIGVSNFSPYIVAHIKRLPAPARVNPSAGTCGKYIRVQWDSVAQALGYLLYRHLYYQVSDTVLLDSVAGTVYHDTVTIDTMYRYFVAAYNAKGRGEYSTGDNAGYLMKKPLLVQWDTANTTHKYVYIKWYYEKMKFRLYRSTDSVTFTLLDTAQTGYNYYLDSSAAPGTPYYYYLTKIIDSTSQESRPSAIVRGMLRPAPPEDSLIVKSSPAAIMLYWKKITAAYCYKLYRSFNRYATVKNQYSFFSATEDTSFAITDSTIDTTMYYKITAVNALGFESLWNVKNTYGWPVKKDTAVCQIPELTNKKECRHGDY